MTIKTIFAVLSGVLLAACAAPGPDPIIAPAVGKTLSGASGVIVLQPDGTMIGKVGPDRNIDLKGTWEIRDRQFCRTVLEPTDLSADTPVTDCRRVDIAGNIVTFTSGTGRRNEWVIQ